MNPYAYYPQTSYFPQTAPQAQAPQIGSFVRVQNEAQAHNYPVAYGASITFIDENAPYCYVKTMGASQLEPPRFEKYKLVKEENAPVDAPKDNVQESTSYATKADCDALSGLYAQLKEEVEAIKRSMTEKRNEYEQSDHQSKSISLTKEP